MPKTNQLKPVQERRVNQLKTEMNTAFHTYMAAKDRGALAKERLYSKISEIMNAYLHDSLEIPSLQVSHGVNGFAVSGYKELERFSYEYNTGDKSIKMTIDGSGSLLKDHIKNIDEQINRATEEDKPKFREVKAALEQMQKNHNAVKGEYDKIKKLVDGKLKDLDKAISDDIDSADKLKSDGRDKFTGRYKLKKTIYTALALAGALAFVAAAVFGIVAPLVVMVTVLCVGMPVINKISSAIDTVYQVSDAVSTVKDAYDASKVAAFVQKAGKDLDDITPELRKLGQLDPVAEAVFQVVDKTKAAVIDFGTLPKQQQYRGNHNQRHHQNQASGFLPGVEAEKIAKQNQHSYVMNAAHVGAAVFGVGKQLVEEASRETHASKHLEREAKQPLIIRGQ